MEIFTQNFHSYSIMKLHGEIDLYNVDELKNEFNSLMAKKIYNIGIDLSDVAYIDSSGLGAFLSVIKEIRNNDGKMLLFNLSESVRKILNLTRLTSFFDISESAEQIEHVFEGSV